jgi:hypothetical protein
MAQSKALALNAPPLYFVFELKLCSIVIRQNHNISNATINHLFDVVSLDLQLVSPLLNINKILIETRYYDNLSIVSHKIEIRYHITTCE